MLWLAATSTEPPVGAPPGTVLEYTCKEVFSTFIMMTVYVPAGSPPREPARVKVRKIISTAIRHVPQGMLNYR